MAGNNPSQHVSRCDTTQHNSVHPNWQVSDNKHRLQLPTKRYASQVYSMPILQFFRTVSPIGTLISPKRSDCGIDMSPSLVPGRNSIESRSFPEKCSIPTTSVTFLPCRRWAPPSPVPADRHARGYRFGSAAQPVIHPPPLFHFDNRVLKKASASGPHFRTRGMRFSSVVSSPSSASVCC